MESIGAEGADKISVNGTKNACVKHISTSRLVLSARGPRTDETYQDEWLILSSHYSIRPGKSSLEIETSCQQMRIQNPAKFLSFHVLVDE